MERKRTPRAGDAFRATRFGLEHRQLQLSGGERQPVALAPVLFLDPPIVLADEPTGNLDSATGGMVLELLLAEQREQNLTWPLVTHDERITRRRQRVVRTADGRVHSDRDERKT